MNTYLKHLLFSSAIAITATGCGGGGSSSGSGDNDGDDRGSDSEQQFQARTVNASSHDQYTYFNLETGETVHISDEQATSSTEWHIGFKRYNVILNGGDSGPSNVVGAIAATQDDFYESSDEPNASVFLNATPDNEQEHLLASYNIDASAYIADEKAAAILGSGAMIGTTLDMGWFNYNVVTHQISLNNDNWWLLRSSAGDSFAKFHATALSYDSGTGLDVTFEFDVQQPGTSQFTDTATFNALIGPAGGEICFDFNSDSEVDCNDTSWDLKAEVIGRNWNLWTNSGVTAAGNGGAFGPHDTATADTYTSGTIAPGGQSIVTLYVEDISAGIFEEQPWYEYNIQNGHQLWPNYRVYMIDLDSEDDTSAQYAIQITSYYSNGGTSGYPSIRYVEQ